MLTSIIIPTYLNVSGLKKCIDSIIKYTSLSKIEVIVVANGAPEEARAYLSSLKPILDIKPYWIDEPIGYTKAMNWGIRYSSGQNIILFNDDCQILDSTKDLWIDLLIEPFSLNNKIGFVGVSELLCRFTNEKFLVGFCLASRREVFKSIGLLDESLGFGHGTEIDLQLRGKVFGWQGINVSNNVVEKNGLVEGSFPIYHEAEKTCNIPEVDAWFRPDALKAQKKLALRKSMNYYKAPFKFHGGIGFIK